MKYYLICLFLIFIGADSFSQLDTTNGPSGPDRSIKYRLERYNSERTKQLYQGRYITLNMASEDTIHTYYGSLVNISNTEVVLSTYQETKSYNDEFHTLEETFDYEESECMTIPIQTIESLTYSPWYSGYSNLITALSGISALFVAPLASIDKDYPYHFNTKRYTRIVVPSLLGVGAGIVLSISLEAGENRFKLKPKLR
jgi:hypothetical protein